MGFIKNKMKLFITGIGTDVGKTVAASIVVESLAANYWKPIQAGDLDCSDTSKVQRLVSNTKSKYYENAYKLRTPASPHYAAQLDGIAIETGKIIEPKTTNHLVIEGAGGVLVPINDTCCVIDLIQSDYKVIVVSRHYLGSINHTLLTLEALKNRDIAVAGIIFSGNKNQATEDIILKKTKANFIGRIEDEPYFDKNVIQYYADLFRANLVNL